MVESKTTDKRIGEIQKFWRHLFGGERGLLQVWTAKRGADGNINRETIVSNNFNYPAAAESAATYALNKSGEGREVYFCAHLLTAPRRIKENAAPVRALWGELDGTPVPNGELKPTALIESSPGRFHIYLRLDDSVPPEVAEQLNQRIAHKIGADPSGFDRTQLLRVPETVNHKYEEKPVVRLVGLDGGRSYSAAELDKLLPAPERPTAEYQPDDSGGDEPPIVLSPEALKVWRGEAPRMKDGGEADRSATLLHIGRVLYDAGGNRRVVVEGVRERDKALGFNKYLNNRDGGRREYERIWEKLQEEGRNKRLKVFIGGGKKKADSSDSSDSFSRKNTFIRTPEFPVDALPESVGRYVREASSSLMCPAELVGVPALCALSATIGHSRALRIKPDWTASASLYAAVIDAPGSRKSPAAAFAYRPLEKLQGELRKDYKEEKKTYDREMRQHAVDKKLAAKNNKPEPEPPAKPTMKRCIVDDITTEALAVRLQENPRGFLSAHDELTGFLRGLDQYKSGGKGNARQSYLKIWSNQPIIVDRKGGDEPVVVPRPYVTLQGAIQPGVLDEIAAGRDDGFLDRFLFGYPESRQGGYSDECISDEATLSYERAIKALWSKTPLEESEDEYEPRIVQMSKEAKELFKATANELQAEMFAPGFPEIMRGAWAKFDLHLARLALILALTRQAHDEREEVNEEDMRNALTLVDYFKDATRKVYGQLFEANPDDVLAADLLTFLKDTGYVFFGTISLLIERLASVALPESPESMGRALRRIAKKTPELSLETKSTGKERIITLRLEKLSEPSEPSEDEDDEVEVGL